MARWEPRGLPRSQVPRFPMGRGDPGASGTRGTGEPCSPRAERERRRKRERLGKAHQALKNSEATERIKLQVLERCLDVNPAHASSLGAPTTLGVPVGMGGAPQNPAPASPPHPTLSVPTGGCAGLRRQPYSSRARPLP